MDERVDITDRRLYQIQNYTLFSGGPSGNGSGSLISDFQTGSFSITFVSLLNETYTTYPIRLDNTTVVVSDIEDTLASDIEEALYALPNKIVDHLVINATLGYESMEIGDVASADVAFLNLKVEMTGSHMKGRQNLFTIDAEECMYPGCTPKLEGMNLLIFSGVGTQIYQGYSSEIQIADHNSYECGRRGRCDYETGICHCFSGFTGNSCDIQTALT